MGTEPHRVAAAGDRLVGTSYRRKVSGSIMERAEG